MAQEVIGFDIGHGESAVARMTLVPLAKPQILEIDGQQSQITAVGTLADGKVVVGERVFRDRVANAQLGFKQRPPGTDEANKALLQFVREYHRLLVSSGQILGGERSHYFVGCPSGWTQDEQDGYRKLLAKALPRVDVVRESRAALLQAREEGRIEPDLIKGTIMVIDLGSSTTDISLVVGGIQEKGIDLGRELGAHLIDKAILDYAIMSSPSRTAIERLVASQPEVRVFLERYCRKAKEEYWKGEETYRKVGTRVLIPLESSDLLLDFRLNGKSMDSILALPHPELKGLSWVGSFVDLLEQVRELLMKRGTTPGVLVLTGGPSRMSFVRSLCKQYFPEATQVWCTPPEETVALGLARWGNIHFQTTGFIEDVEAICSTAVPAAVNKEALKIRERLADEVSAGIVRDVVKPLLVQWREGIWSTLDDMQEQLKRKVEAWLATPAAHAAIHRSYTEPLREIHSEINSLTFDICSRYGIPHSSLRLDLDLEVNSEKLELPVGNPFDAVTGVATGVSFAVLLVLTGIAKGTLLTVSIETGPPGWLVGALVAAWIGLFGTMALHEAVSGWNFPLAVRRMFLSDDRCDRIADDARSRLRESLIKSIDDSELEKIKRVVSQQVSTQLRERADEVRWIIS